MAEKTLTDFIAKDNKDIPFEERAKKFEERIKPICEELGIGMAATLQPTPTALTAVACLQDLWASGRE